MLVEPDGRTKRPVVRGSRIHAGETIATAEDGRLAIALLPGALVQLEPESRFFIEKLALGKNGFAAAEAMHRSVRVRLMEGTLFCLVRFETEPPDWILETPHGRLLTGSGGLCRIEVGGGKTRIICARGGFTFQSEDGTVPIPLEPGYVYDWPPHSTPFPAELDLQTLPAIQLTTNVERNLLELEAGLRFKPYPWR